MSSATFIGIRLSRELIGILCAVRGRWQETLKARSDSSAWLLLDLVRAHPAVEPVNEDRRKRRWIAHEVIAELDRFIDRAKRPSSLGDEARVELHQSV